MNGADLPFGRGGPPRLRLPRQLGCKSVKPINRIVLAESLMGFGKGKESAAVEPARTGATASSGG